jgi:hypothetical protein
VCPTVEFTLGIYVHDAECQKRCRLGLDGFAEFNKFENSFKKIFTWSEIYVTMLQKEIRRKKYEKCS